MQFINLIHSNTSFGYSILRIASLLLLLSNSLLINSQTIANQDDGYLWFDSIVSAKNTNLYNGLIEVEKFRMGKDKHKFYNSQNFQSAKLHYEGQAYHGVQLKYDLYEDIVLINGGNPIRLENDKIDSFSIGVVKFINLTLSDINGLNLVGFFEILIDTPIYKLFKKHKKNKLDRLGDKRIYHDFLDDNRYYILFEEKIYQVNSKKEISKIFPQYRKELNVHSKKYPDKQSKEGHLLYLLKHVNELVSIDKNPKTK